MHKAEESALRPCQKWDGISLFCMCSLYKDKRILIMWLWRSVFLILQSYRGIPSSFLLSSYQYSYILFNVSYNNHLFSMYMCISMGGGVMVIFPTLFLYILMFCQLYIIQCFLLYHLFLAAGACLSWRLPSIQEQQVCPHRLPQ